jgi:hypothetical protein
MLTKKVKKEKIITTSLLSWHYISQTFGARSSPKTGLALELVEDDRRDGVFFIEHSCIMVIPKF